MLFQFCMGETRNTREYFHTLVKQDWKEHNRYFDSYYISFSWTFWPFQNTIVNWVNFFYWVISSIWIYIWRNATKPIRQGPCPQIVQFSKRIYFCALLVIIIWDFHITLILTCPRWNLIHFSVCFSSRLMSVMSYHPSQKLNHPWRFFLFTLHCQSMPWICP